MTSQTLTYDATRPQPAAASRGLLARVMDTRDDAAPVVLRVTLASAMVTHGVQKLFGWFGGYGWEGTLGFLTGAIGLPKPIAAAMIVFEAVGPLFLLAGLWTRAFALGFAGIMLGAIATVHAEHGYFMNWDGTQAGEGFEYHLLVIGIALALVIRGSGAWSLDRALTTGRAASGR